VQIEQRSYVFKKVLLTITYSVIFVVMGCTGGKAVPSNDATVKVLSNHEAETKTYRLPKGAFHGFFWDFKKYHAFEIWMVRGDEFYIYIPTPDEFLAFEEEPDRADAWDYKVTDNRKENTITYLISNKEKAISLEVTLPIPAIKPKGYCFGVLTNHLGKYVVAFGSLSDYGIDENKESIFGYVLLKPKNTF
jgi:hypothetical protein